jgi:hypothetical protein
VVFVCPHCAAETEIDDELRLVWRRADGKGSQSTQVLRPILHVEGIRDNSTIPGKWTISGTAQVFSRVVRGLWRDIAIASTSRQSRCNGQPTGEYSNLVCQVPCVEAQKAAENLDLHGLWNHFCGEGSSVESEDLLCFVCGRMGPHQCVQTTRSRVGRLRAYGNAIVPQAAAEFIMATAR